MTVSPTEYLWREWRLGEGRFKGKGPCSKPRPSVLPKVIPPAWWARLAAFLAKRKPTPIKPALYGQVIDVSHVTGYNELGRAFCSQTGKVETEVQVLFGQGGPDEQRALDRFAQWAAEWRTQGCLVGGWFRMNAGGNPNEPTRVTVPQPHVPVDRWWPDAENDLEINRLGELYANGTYPGITTLGKRPGAYPPPGGSIMYQSFRESWKSDTDIRNCRDFWLAAGLPLERHVAMIQNYQINDGTPDKVAWFEPPLDQVKTALSLGIRRVSIYPLKDNISPATVREIARLLAEAA